MSSIPPTYDDVRAAFDNGSVLTASKQELEQLLMAVGQQRILHPANQARAAEMGETMRQLLAARQSQEIHGQALRISKIALVVAVAAFFAGVFQAAVAVWPLLNQSPTEVYAKSPIPVQMESKQQTSTAKP